MKWIGLIYHFFFLFGKFIIPVSTREIDQSNDNDNNGNLTLPNELIVGVSTSSYQMEGAWNESGKGKSYWDSFLEVHSADKVADGSNAYVSDDFYHHYKGDIQLVKNAGFDAFRFSMSWSRIFPSGYATNPNEDGVRFYHNILDELEKRGVAPFVTLFHWDYPKILEDQLGGWLNESMAYVFADYAKFIFKEYGSRVKNFVTFNEHQVSCHVFYIIVVDNVTNNKNYYTCIHNMIKAHALAYRVYDDEFRIHQKGLIGIVQLCPYFYSVKKGDELARDLALEFSCFGFVDPIFSKNGDYSDMVKKKIAEKSRAQGLIKSKLPEFSKEWIEYIKGTSDFFGLNHYYSVVVQSLPESEMSNWPNDEGLMYNTFHSSIINLQRDHDKFVPKGFKEVLKSIRNKYNNPLVYVTESGVPDVNGTINDNLRVNYLYSYMKEALEAIKEDHCNVKGFFIWSLLDCFEWDAGYTQRHGIYHVDFQDENRKRTPKDSVKWLKSVLESRELQSPVLPLSGCDSIINNIYDCLKN